MSFRFSPTPNLHSLHVANYFRFLVGVPPSNIRLLQSFKAGRADLHKVLSSWPQLYVAKQAIMIVYYSGQVLLTPTGNVLLAPYEGSLAAMVRLYPFSDIESDVARLKAKQPLPPRRPLVLT
ncbi:MAG: hypothetical protein HP493_10730 [Nitrospira sp.]|nr:hypothetical protein [Nitrospira sp.]